MDLARELGDISAGIAAALRDTDLPLSDRVCTLLFGVVSYYCVLVVILLLVVIVLLQQLM